MTIRATLRVRRVRDRKIRILRYVNVIDICVKKRKRRFLFEQSRIIERDCSYLGYHTRCRGFLAFYAYAKDVHITKDPPRTFSFAY